MYIVIDSIHGNEIDSEWEDFCDAMNRALELAEEQAGDEYEVATYENGFRKSDGSGQWEAGACPYDDDGAYWPSVRFKK